MKEKSKSLSSYVLHYSLFPAAVMIVYSIIFRLSGVILHLIHGKSALFNVHLPFIFVIIVMIYGTIKYRKQNLNGYISYSKAFTTCFLIGLFIAIINGAFNFIYFKYIDPGVFHQRMNEIVMEQIRSKTLQMTDQILAIYTSMLHSPLFVSLLFIFILTIFSVIFSLVLAIFLKKKDKSLPTTV